MDESPPTQEELRATQEEIGAQAKALPYLAAISSAKALVIPETPFTEFPGLQAVQRVRSSGAGDTLITYWSSESHFEMNRDAIVDRLGASVAFSGGLGALEAPKKQWHKRYTAFQLIVSASALVGAFNVLHALWERLYVAPSMAVVLENTEQHHVVAGQPFSVKATVENFHSSVDNYELRTVASLQPLTGKAVTLTVPNAPVALAAGKSHGVTITGKAHDPGSYVLNVEVSAKGGWLRERVPFKTQAEVRAWPAEPEPQPLRMGSRAFPTIAAQVEVGRDAPGGVVCSATLRRSRLGPLAMNWWLPKPAASEYGVYGSEVVVVRWAWPKLAGRTEPTAEWSFKDVTPEEMKEMVKTGTIRCIAKEITP